MSKPVTSTPIGGKRRGRKPQFRPSLQSDVSLDESVTFNVQENGK